MIKFLCRFYLPFKTVAASSFAALAVAGCGSNGGPDIADVYGTVTLDGQPLADATVTFKPEKLRASIGVTDESGDYELLFKTNTPGALIGPHSVYITTERDPSGGEGVSPLVSASAEKLPPRYNNESELSAEVTSSGGRFDFDLSSDGAE